VENRDACREESQANLDEAMIKSGVTDTPKARKLKLITLFSDCMGKYGWEVPVPGDKEAKIAADVPIYESTVSKIAAAKTAPPKDGLNPGATDPKVIEGETRQDQQTLERKVPPENVGKQDRQAQSNNQPNNQSNNRAVASQNQPAKDTRTIKDTQQDQGREVQKQPATTARAANPQPNNAQQRQDNKQAQPQPKSQPQQQAQATANNNNSRTLNQATQDRQAAEADQPREMRKQPAVTAKPANQPQRDNNTQLAQLEPQAGPQTQPQPQTNNSKSTTTNNNSRTVVQNPDTQQNTQQNTVQEQQPQEVRRQPATTARAATSPAANNKSNNPQQAQSQLRPQAQQQAQVTATNNTARTLNQATQAQQKAEADQPREMLKQPAVTAKPANQPQRDNMQLAQLEPQAGPQTQPQSETNNNNSTTTNNNSRTIVQNPEPQQNIQQNTVQENQPQEVRRQPVKAANPKLQNRQNVQEQNRQAAPVTTVGPESPEQALTQSIQKRPAETQIRYQNRNNNRRSANDNGPTQIPQQPATTGYQQGEPRVAAVIDPANNQTPVTAITADSPDQALMESIHRKPIRHVNRNSRTANQQGQTQAQTSTRAQGQTQAQSAAQPQQQAMPQQPAQQITNRSTTAAAVAPATVNNVNNTRYSNNTTNTPAANDNNPSKIPSQPGVSKTHINPRAAECELARRNAATSPAAAQKAKGCEAECAKIMKANPKIINPAPCPVKDTAVNVLDVQLGNKK
jgi:hypothetical protein